MKRISIFIALLLSVLISIAQTQSGYVRTLGRPDKKGEPLSGVSIRAKGEHNTVLSDDNGNFSLLLTGKKNGDAYSLQQVVKSGYELNELGMIGRPYAFSDKIPLTIVMVSTAQLQAEKIRIENNAYQIAENNYKLRLASLEKQREEKSITIEEYRKEIQDLQVKFEKYQSLISSLAEHYAHTDYDVLNETEREINLCIENGDLERADSLIHTLFNPVDVLKRNSESLARIDRNIRQANEIIRQANEDMAAFAEKANAAGFDAALVAHDLKLEHFRAAFFDMDSTLVANETLDEMARMLGLGEKCAEITHLAMTGVIKDYAASLKARVELLAGLDASCIETLQKTLSLNPGVEALMQKLNAAHVKTFVVSSGFTIMTEIVRSKLSMSGTTSRTCSVNFSNGRAPTRLHLRKVTS